MRPPVPPGLGEDWTWEANGALLVGEKASLLQDTYAASVRVVPDSKAEEHSAPPETIARVEGGHYEEWIRACKGGPAAGSNFEYSGPLTEMVLLGNLAIRSGRKLNWDASEMRVTNYAEANRFVKRDYRDGWGV